MNFSFPSSALAQNNTEDNVSKLIDIGTSLWNSGNYTEASRYIDRALSIDPNNMAALYGKARILWFTHGNFTESRKYYDRAMPSIPMIYMR